MFLVDRNYFLSENRWKKKSYKVFVVQCSAQCTVNFYPKNIVTCQLFNSFIVLLQSSAKWLFFWVFSAKKSVDFMLCKIGNKIVMVRQKVVSFDCTFLLLICLKLASPLHFRPGGTNWADWDFSQPFFSENWHIWITFFFQKNVPKFACNSFASINDRDCFEDFGPNQL